MRVCTGTACWAADFDDHVRELEAGLGVAMGECSADGELSLGETVCLGFCHSSPSFRDGDVIDAGPGALGRVLAGSARAGARARVAERPRRPRPHPAGRLVGPPAGARRAQPRAAPRGGEGGEPPRPRRRRLPRRAQVGVHGEEPLRGEVHRRQRRRGRPGLLHRQAPDGVEPRAPARGHGARGLRGRRGDRLRLRALRVPALQARARARRSAARTRRATSATTSTAAASPSTSTSRRAPGRTSSARRPRSSTRSRGCAARSPRGRRSRRRRATTRSRPW